MFTVRKTPLTCLCPKEISARTGRSYCTVLRHIKSGHLKAVRQGPRLWVVSPLEFARYAGWARR